MESDKEKWNRRFASEDSFLGKRPSPFLQNSIETIKKIAPGVRALDVACGEGRNAVFLAEQGFIVTALDISDVGLAKGFKRAEEKGVKIDFKQVDLDFYNLIGEYDLVINFNFLLHRLIPQEVEVLSEGGIILFDTIRQSPTLLQNHDPSFLLKSGELYDIFSEFTGKIIHFDESDSGDMPTARLMFKKGV